MIECTCDDYELFSCHDCSACTNCNYEYYMVHNSIWDSIANDAFMLCIGCLESRRGQLLTKDDFTDAPLNTINLITGSTRLKDRLRKVAASATI